MTTTAFAAPAISRWIGASAGRHYITLLVATATIAVCNALGAHVDASVYALMGVWILSNAALSPWAARPLQHEVRLRRYAATVVVDLTFLAAAYYLLVAIQFAGVVFFTHMVMVAGATLPRRWAVAIAGYASLLTAILLVLAVTGRTAGPSPIAMPPVTGNWLFVIAGIGTAVGAMAMLLHLQGRLIGSIRDTELRYVTVVQSARDMVMTFDQHGRFVDANPAALEQSGYTWEEIKAMPNRALFPPAEWPRVVDALRRSMEGESVRFDLRYCRKDGTERLVEAQTARLSLDGAPSVLVVARDVTDERRQTEALREKDEQLSLVLEALDVGFYTIDRQGIMTSAFGRWARERIAAGEQLIGAPAIVSDTPAASAEILRDAMRRAIDGESVTVRTQRPKDGMNRWYRTHLVPMRDARGAVVAAAGLWVDETALVVAESETETLRARVAAAERMESLGKLVSGVAHELNNPLAAILNFTEGLLADARSDADRAALEVVQAQALRSRTIVRDLLTYVRRGAARPMEPLAPVPILERIAFAMRPALAADGVAFLVDLRGGDALVNLDRSGFEQVVSNLITNAAFAAGSGGTVRLTSRVRQGRFEVGVEDNGGGIPPPVAPRMFEPFFTTKPTGKGVGLGLSVSLGIVEALGGTLAGENRPADVGGGARFVVSLPLLAGTATMHTSGEVAMPKAVQAPPVDEPPSGPKRMPERRPTILIVDDEDAIRQAFGRYLTRRGWAVQEARDGADALARLVAPDAARVFDVVLCDLKMAGVSGFDVYDRVLAASPALARRFIFSTGDTTGADVAPLLANLTVPVLEKPFEMAALEELADRVRRTEREDARADDPAPA